MKRSWQLAAKDAGNTCPPGAQLMRNQPWGPGPAHSLLSLVRFPLSCFHTQLSMPGSQLSLEEARWVMEMAVALKSEGLDSNPSSDTY